jgi:hypothetical protein
MRLFATQLQAILLRVTQAPGIDTAILGNCVAGTAPLACDV